MLFMNEFLEQHWDGMRSFLQTVSNSDTEMPMTSFDGYVDLPLRLAVLHGLLVDIIYQKNQVGNTSRSVLSSSCYIDLALVLNLCRINILTACLRSILCCALHALCFFARIQLTSCIPCLRF